MGLAVVLDRACEEHLIAQQVYAWPPAIAA
jgi:hypothetical protein